MTGLVPAVVQDANTNEVLEAKGHNGRAWNARHSSTRVGPLCLLCLLGAIGIPLSGISARQIPEAAQKRPRYSSTIMIYEVQDISPRVIIAFTGGQGSIDVNSWAPDSRRFAYVTYAVLSAGADPP